MLVWVHVTLFGIRRAYLQAMPNTYGVAFGLVCESLHSYRLAGTDCNGAIIAQLSWVPPAVCNAFIVGDLLANTHICPMQMWADTSGQNQKEVTAYSKREQLLHLYRICLY